MSGRKKLGSFVGVSLFGLFLFGIICTSMASIENISLDAKDLSAPCNLFCLDVYKVLALAEKKNIVYSPFGLHTLLSLLSYGADNLTLEELKSALRLTNDKIHNKYKEVLALLNNADPDESIISISNAVYIQNDFPIIKQFLDISSEYFYADVANVDFSNKDDTIEMINAWVKGKTNDKIRSFLEPTHIDEFTKLVLLNAIYFKSTWVHRFQANDTALKNFHITNSVIKKVPMMVKQAAYVTGSLPDLQAQYIEIPYKYREYVMVILMPDDIDGLSLLESKFNPNLLSNLQSSEESSIRLQLPKFKFEVTINLNDILREVGIKTMFSDNADFSKMCELKKSLKVSDVFQKVYVEVNEEGTEAAAASGAVMRLKRSIMSAEDFIVDRPFMFLIKHKKSDIPLFVGSVRDFEDIEPIRDEL